ncbi:uncharacterized protein BDZ99DRAFT_558529 [Mytilinidion resinicola]|uniref:Uncharacterized protein n=1 Tax=Mytilinidion resinicola TaxID=574789 RepID=A0A6A6YX60_9PEZI|nr:uncharacterized protein BDZ99DRAFT_558529 [Mytilinidion resinicola]KAF2812497.1 hypothetical protein BDZ99DRAFT_558529 [Mytilinidion resinicola]
MMSKVQIALILAATAFLASGMPAAPVTQILDGQIKAPPGVPVNIISDGQAQAQLPSATPKSHLKRDNGGVSPESLQQREGAGLGTTRAFAVAVYLYLWLSTVPKIFGH